MTRIELIYDRDCPNAPVARANLRRALQEADLPASWEEWDREGADSPGYVKSYGSPTILVDGRDVTGAESQDLAACCRLYPGPGGRFQGAPSVLDLVSAFIQRKAESKSGDAPEGQGKN